MLTNIYVLTFVVSICINLFFFILAYGFRTDKFTDFTYGLTFVFLALTLLFRNQTFYSFQLLTAAMVVIWAIRLVAYLLTRILKIKKDSRFNTMRQKPGEFLKFWLFQGLAVWVIMLPSIYLLTTNQDRPISLIMLLGIAIWIVGIAIETIADWQKFSFKNVL